MASVSKLNYSLNKMPKQVNVHRTKRARLEEHNLVFFLFYSSVSQIDPSRACVTKLSCSSAMF